MTTNYKTSISNFDITVGEPAVDSLGSGRQIPTESHSSKAAESAITREPRSTTSVLPDAVAANWGKISKARLTKQMYGNIVRVATQSRGMAPAVTAASLGNFLEFWMRIRNAAVEPEVVLAPDGTLYAEWYKSKHQRLDVRFTVNKAIFGLFAGSSILEGAERPETVANLLKQHAAKPLQWAAD